MLIRLKYSLNMSRIENVFGSKTNLIIGKAAAKRCVFGLKICAWNVDEGGLMRRPGKLQQAPFS